MADIPAESFAAELHWIREMGKFRTTQTQVVQVESHRAVAAYLEEQKRAKLQPANDQANQ